MSILQPSPVMQPATNASAIINAIGSLLATAPAVAVPNNATRNSASVQGNVMALFSTLIQHAGTTKSNAATNVATQHVPSPSPLDDLEQVAGITLDDNDLELDLNENSLVTLKKRFPRLDTNLRDNLEVLGQELQECTLKVEKRKKSWYVCCAISIGPARRKIDRGQK
jgi:hypothetical protein